MGANERELPPEQSEGAGSGTETARGLVRICAILIITLCAAVAVEAWRLESWTVDGAGPGLLPQILLVLIATTAAFVAISPGDPPKEGEAGPVLSNRNFLAYAGAMVGTAVSAQYLGYIIPGFFAVLLVMRFGEERSWSGSLLWAVVLIACLTGIFGYVLGVPFPPGPAESSLIKLGLLRAG